MQRTNAARECFAACLTPLFAVGSSELGAVGSPVARSLLRGGGSKARSYTLVPPRFGFGQVGGRRVIDTDFLADVTVSAVTFVTGTST
jgi:hypothetical protein